MTSTYSTSLRLELMATGDQNGTWGVTNNLNLGTLLEQAITGVLSVAEGDTTLTLTNTDGASNQARNAVVNLTGAMTGAHDVIVPTANKLYLIKNSTTGGYSVTVKTVAGTGVAVLPGTNRWVYCDGTNVVDGQNDLQTLSLTALSPATTDALALGTTALMWSDLFLASGAVINFNNGDVTITHAANTLTFGGASSGYAFTGGPVVPATNDASALGTSTLMWSDLFLASGAVINFNNGDVTITHSANTLAFAGASSGYTFDAAVKPSADDAAALGASGTAWADLFLASGGVINWNAGDVTITHSANTLAFAGASSGYTFDAVIQPATNDAAALGASGTAWADLFLASGGVINWNAGDVTITHSANTLAFAGASSGYTFDAVAKPSANDAAALGASGTAWADLFLASGSVINWNAGDVTLTHSANALSFAGASSGVGFDGTTFINAGANRLVVGALASGDVGYLTQADAVGTRTAAAFLNASASQVGSITQTAFATAYNTSSDPRLKEQVQNLTASGVYIDSLRPVEWQWKADGSYGAGFLAPEFAAVNPRAVTGEEGAVDEQGQPVYQALDAATPETIAHIVAELQSLRERVRALEG